MNDNELLREMIREVIEEDWKSKLAGAALAVCTAAGCSPVQAPGGGIASPADYGIPGEYDMEFEDERERPGAEEPAPTKLRHPNIEYERVPITR